MADTSFSYTAVTGDGREVAGSLRAADAAAAGNHLRGMGVFPVSLVPARSVSVAPRMAQASAGADRSLGPRLRGRALTTFTRQLATLLRAGMPLVRALRLLEEQAAEMGVRRIIGSLAASIEGGASFSDALAQWPRSFGALFVSMAKAGEASGQMENVLERQAELLEKRLRLVRKVRGAMAYPVIVCLVALAITAGLMVFIVPKFAAVFEEMLGGAPLPTLTRWVIVVSNILLRRLPSVAVSVVAVVCLWRLFRATRVGRYWSDRAALRLPGFGPLILLSSCAQFCATLGTLTAAGVSILSALRMTRDASANRVLATALDRIHEGVKEGESISLLMRRTRAFPAMLVGMVQVGEETGALPEMLRHVAQDYENEVDAAVDALTSAIEPAMIVMLAALVGTIVIALFLPLIRLVGLMSGGL